MSRDMLPAKAMRGAFRSWQGWAAAACAAVMAATPFVAAFATDDRAALEDLGRQLFFDANLSRERTQSCASCHDPEHAFTDPRENATGRAASLGDDGQSLGTRNTPSLMYATYAPELHVRANGRKSGGYFWDGRAATLEEQARGPLLNPAEMNMPDAAAVTERIRENPDHAARFGALFGPGILDDDQAVLDSTARALAAYQRSAEFAPFDSKYDRYMRGEAQLTPLENFGRAVFVTWNCQNCHTSMYRGNPALELFTSYDHHNIGVPDNPDLPPHQVAEADRDRVMPGMMKTPTLRNIAVTGPYMHNGSISELETALRFYNRYLSPTDSAQTNPETGQPWPEPPHPETLSRQELESGIALSDPRVVALEAFLRTLTDRRYEHLLPRD